MRRVGLSQARWPRFFLDSRLATGRTVGYQSNAKVMILRKHRWTVLGAVLLALLALVALVWFPPARPGVDAPTAASAPPLPDASRR